MIHISIKTEYSFKQSFLKISDIHKYVDKETNSVGIADVDNVYGHIPFQKESEKHGFKPIFGTRIKVTKDSKQRTCNAHLILIALNNDGLREMYDLVHKSYDQFYYFPRLLIDQIDIISNNIVIIDEYGCFTDNSICFVGNQPSTNHIYESSIAGQSRYIAIDNNNYGDQKDREVYQLLAGARKHGGSYINLFENSIYPQHVLSEKEYNLFCNYSELSISSAREVAKKCNAKIEKAEMVKWEFNSKKSKIEVLKSSLNKEKMVDFNDKYMTRLESELELIADKKYEDYFLIVSDLIRYCKAQGMLVGPSRGSSAGSLVCYLLDITEIDPIRYDLVFERFIDVNRFDLPDIDIDFPDSKRQIAIDYLKNKYGKDNVACLSNINRLKSRSAIGEFAKSLNIPQHETEEIKNAIIQRNTGDARAGMCIEDTFKTTEIGKEFIKHHPEMQLVSHIEDHASHAGKHAAGILVSTLPLKNYSAINPRDDVVMMDKKNAEYLGLLKIDCLGLRTLSIIEDTCNQVGIKISEVYNIDLNDQKTFDLMNEIRLNGIFQFEGQSLKLLVQKIGVHCFQDFVAITALARPGALSSGGTNNYIAYKNGEKDPVYKSELHKNITKDTLGVVIYQEQMMRIAKEIGGMTWADVSDLRRAASKSLGDEFFSKYKIKFMEGASKNGYSQEDSEYIWKSIASTGSWTFNLAHAVSYGYLSYITAYLKANHPREFAVANLNHARDKDSTIRLLREIDKEGIKYIPVDPDESSNLWRIRDDGMLIGPLTNIDGIGQKNAMAIVKKRLIGASFTPSIMKKLMAPKTPYDILYPTKHHWGFLYNDPKKYGLDMELSNISDLEEGKEAIVIGLLKKRDLRDRNDYQAVAKRGGSLVTEGRFYLKFTIEDDTGSILCMLAFKNFENMNGLKLYEKLSEDKTWIIAQGIINDKWHLLNVTKIADLNNWKEKL